MASYRDWFPSDETIPVNIHPQTCQDTHSTDDNFRYPIAIRLSSLPLFKREPSNGKQLEPASSTADHTDTTVTANEDKRPSDAETLRINHEARIAQFKEDFDASYATTEDDTDDEKTFTKEERQAQRAHNRLITSQFRKESEDWTKSILAQSGSWEDVWAFHRCRSNPNFWRDESQHFLSPLQAASTSCLENVSGTQARQLSGLTDISDMEKEAETTDTDSDNKRSREKRRRVDLKEGREVKKESSEAWAERMVRRKQRCERNRRRREYQTRLGQLSVSGDVSGRQADSTHSGVLYNEERSLRDTVLLDYENEMRLALTLDVWPVETKELFLGPDAEDSHRRGALIAVNSWMEEALGKFHNPKSKGSMLTRFPPEPFRPTTLPVFHNAVNVRIKLWIIEPSHQHDRVEKMVFPPLKD
ncbi:hypothetical protein BJ508DRAFT_316263 [Ascobolus immersus RN42]|uniref:Uncharacterized protein n=1 Tax=Ascobolus immersus RN42 TaxID=1160509 RepID=A0A3N4HEY8_ASCIM|nr:hypothetical protein BJ508DRAFT_316263 [Ascobolus immersus RN42]